MSVGKYGKTQERNEIISLMVELEGIILNVLQFSTKSQASDMQEEGSRHEQKMKHCKKGKNQKTPKEGQHMKAPL